MPDCRNILFESVGEDDDDPEITGENCHICANSDEGPRADSTMPTKARDSYSNLILLCCNHHKIVDSMPEHYSIEHLKAIKTQHEQWVVSQLGFDMQKQADDEYYATVIDRWSQSRQIQQWSGWTYNILSPGCNRLSCSTDEDLRKTQLWLLTRVWPKRYESLEKAFFTYRSVSADILATFSNHSELSLDESYFQTRKFYRIDRWDTSLYRDLVKKYEDHVELLADLVVELCRAANFIADEVRLCISRSYRLDEGRFCVEQGPMSDFSTYTSVAEYSRAEKALEEPYLGLTHFLKKYNTST